MRGYLVPEPNHARRLVADCKALMGLRDTLAGPTLLNWGAGTPLAQWAGVQVSGEPRRVAGLEIKSWQGVRRHESHLLHYGRLPKEIGNLDQLQTLDLCHRLLDAFPPEVERLQHLREPDLRLHDGHRMLGCLSAAFVEQLNVAEGVRDCAQESGA